MLDNLRHQFSVLYIAPELLRDGFFFVIVVLVRWRQVNIHRRALACEDFRRQTVLTEVNLRAIDLIKQDGWNLLKDLYGKRRTLDDVHTADERVDDERGLWRIVDTDGVSLALDPQGKTLAFCDQDRLVDLGFDFHRTGGRVEILDDPLVAVQLLLWRLLGSQALWLGFLAWWCWRMSSRR